MLYTFQLIDGRKVTYEGAAEAVAHRRARDYHGAAVDQCFGQSAQRCACAEKRAHSTRQAGWLICTDCAGYIG